MRQTHSRMRLECGMTRSKATLTLHKPASPSCRPQMPEPDGLDQNCPAKPHPNSLQNPESNEWCYVKALSLGWFVTEQKLTETGNIQGTLKINSIIGAFCLRPDLSIVPLLYDKATFWLPHSPAPPLKIQSFSLSSEQENSDPSNISALLTVPLP